MAFVPSWLSSLLAVHAGREGRALHAVLAALAVVAALAACGDDVAPRTEPQTTPTVDRSAADPATGMTTDLDGVAPAFGDAVLAELTGDEVAARAGFERLLAATDAPAALAARAALHLAQIEARAGRDRHALDLVVRAAALAPSDVVIAEGVAQLRADAVAASSAGNIRGPKLGTPLPGVAPEVAEAFAAAERGLAMVHKLRRRPSPLAGYRWWQYLSSDAPIFEALSSSIRAKEDATESVAAKYRAVAEHGGLALVAAHYRAGSLYHDLALGLLFELPPELDPAVAAGLRRTLRARSLAYIKRAVTEYRTCLAAPPPPEGELWRLAAETDLHAAQDVLGEAGEPR